MAAVPLDALVGDRVQTFFQLLIGVRDPHTLVAVLSQLGHFPAQRQLRWPGGSMLTLAGGDALAVKEVGWRGDDEGGEVQVGAANFVTHLWVRRSQHGLATRRHILGRSAPKPVE